MGTEFQVMADCMLRSLSFKLSNDSANHRWEILRSSTPGLNVPSLSSYTEVLATGVADRSEVEQGWADIELPGDDIELSENDWIICHFYVGVGGQSFSINTERGNSNLSEELLRVYAGVYKYQSSANPASLGAPTNRSTGTSYGIMSARVGTA